MDFYFIGPCQLSFAAGQEMPYDISSRTTSQGIHGAGEELERHSNRRPNEGVLDRRDDIDSR